MRLILAALEHREQLSDQEKRKVPVPILVTAQDWDPDPQPVADWLVRQLQETYTLFARAAGATTAAAMIATGKIAMILDGLDEMAADLRSVALEALDEQAAFRIVILSRTAEMASAASRHVLQGAAAIELRPVNPAEAASYLERIQLDRPLEGWRNLIERIRTGPASPLRKALDNPLTLTLVRDTYLPGDDVRELLEFSDTALHGVPADQAVEAITDHLLGRLLPTAYAHRPGQAPLPYDLPTAQNALTKIAARMNQDGTRDLQWWQLPAWTRAPQRAVMAGLVTGLVTWLVAGLWFAQGKEIEFVVLGGLVGVVTAIPKELMGFGGNQPRSISKLRPRKALSRSLFVGAGIGAGIGAVLGLSLTVNSLATKLVVALALGLAFGLAGGLVTGLAAGLTADPDSNSSLSPANSWRNDQEYGLVLGILTGLVTGLVTWLVTGLAFALSVGLIVGLWYGLKSSEAWPVSLTAVQLAIKWHTPVRLMKFLNDAHHRDILRIVGPTYQFRHARLQDRLAAEAGNGDGNVASDRAKANSL